MCCVIKASLVSTCAFSGKAYELHDKLQEDYPRGWVEACRTRGGHSLILEDIEEAVMASAFPVRRFVKDAPDAKFRTLGHSFGYYFLC